jgi:alpha-galactosidase
MSVDTSVAIPDRAGRFYQHGWHSWAVTGWRPRHIPARYPSVPAHRLHSTDPAHLDDPYPGGSALGAVELGDGAIRLLGSLGVDGWVTAEPDRLAGGGPGPWYESAGEERQVFSNYASALARSLGRRTGEAGPIWCSWYSFYEGVTEVALRKVLADLGDLAFRIIQVDDGWQRANGDWDANADFPSGMAAMADQIRATHRLPGLWLAPFVVDEHSELFDQHPEMLLRDGDGAPVAAAYNWRQTTYALDVTRNDVLEWLAELTEKAVGWGYRYLKLDFLLAGALPGSRATDIGREAGYRRAIESIRNAAGDDVYLLGCGAPVIPSIGVFDGIRVGPDVAEYWDNVDRTVHLDDRAGPGAADAIATSLSRLWLQPLIDVDPDVAYFRSRYSLLTPEQRAQLADLAHICGFRATSDPPEWLDPAERAALEQFLDTRPVVEQIDRYRFLLDDREVDFTEIVEGRPW